MKIREYSNWFREVQKKLPINDSALTKTYLNVEKLENDLKNLITLPKSKVEYLAPFVNLQNLETGLYLESNDEGDIYATAKNMNGS